MAKQATRRRSSSTPSSLGSAGKRSSSGKSTRNAQEKQHYPLLEKFFIDELKDIYWAEKHLVKALGKLKRAATTEELQQAFEDHTEATQEHIARLEQVFEIFEKRPQAKKCEAMDGLTREAAEIIDDTKAGTMTRDVALIIAAQKVEHYEIATYGGLVQLAHTMKMPEVVEILEQTLQEEKDTDQLLTYIAENDINMEAEMEGAASEEKD